MAQTILNNRIELIRAAVIKEGFLVHRAAGRNTTNMWTFTNKHLNTQSIEIFNTEDEAYEYVKEKYDIQIILPGS